MIRNKMFKAIITQTIKSVSYFYAKSHEEAQKHANNKHLLTCIDSIETNTEIQKYVRKEK